MKGKPLISFCNVSKIYDDKVVLKNLNLDIYKGEFVTVIGGSGSGKTTALKLINGLITPDDGKIIVDGKNLKDTNLIELRKNIGYVIQSIGLFPHMTVEKNISFVLDLNKNKKDNSLEKVKELMNTVQLEEELITRYPSQLSGGQKQRVGIARALASNPYILLMDEPFGAVDEITRHVLQDELLKIQKQLGITIFFITHDINEALKLGSKIIIMNDGKIEQIGTSDEIKCNPNSEFVKKLIAY
ncbi:ATP-binding cassette domain-containing protein [Clostridium senegalense]|uniref:ABC-type quaternary amine transporter n=1 Tax=Clostridium senegalense TaxID=1465809 RepID=A0A6M0H3N4_9CLOT|nr:ABC transporter ATP-binding protein [Clostridium senegalense]NEU04471.1 ABC transporter ATP-binding protein [Clostridium senegalense]